MASTRHPNHRVNRNRMAQDMVNMACTALNADELDAEGRQHLWFLVSHAGLDWFVVLATQTGRKACSVPTAEACRSLLMDRLAKPAPSKHRIG